MYTPKLDRRDRQDLLEQLRCAYFQTAGQFSDQILWNINTPEAYNSLREEEAFS